MVRPLRIAVLVKQIPKFEAMALGPDGRLVRDGLELEMNAYCRRAVSKGCELAAETGGSVTVLTLGPPPAEDVLREAVAWGLEQGLDAPAISGVLVSDAAFAGSDTLATATALAAALAAEGPFDLVLLGRASVDADTGQVPPELAELAGLPYLCGVKQLTVRDGDADGGGALVVDAGCEYDDGWVDATVVLPAVLSCAERLCEPSKVPPEGRAAVPADRIRTLTAADLGAGPWGQAASPTAVGEVKVVDVPRDRTVLTGPVDAQVAAAVELLVARGAFEGEQVVAGPVVPAPSAHRDGPVIGVVVEPDRVNLTAELLGTAAAMAADLHGWVVALGPGIADPQSLGPLGADEVEVLDCANVEEDVAAGVGDWAAAVTPWAVLVPGTVWGREVGSRVAARLGAGLTGDAVGLEVGADGRLVAWKPAFGGGLVAAITASSPVQMATVRAGVLNRPAPRAAGEPIPVSHRAVASRGRVVVHRRTREDDVDALATAEVVVAVGQGVPPERYGELDPLLSLLGAELGATRKVTDKGWMAHARQIGITGRSIAPRLFVVLGASGKFNHMVGVRAAGTVVAVNRDADAPVWKFCDVGIQADWEEALPLLTMAIAAQLEATTA